MTFLQFCFKQKELRGAVADLRKRRTKMIEFMKCEFFKVIFPWLLWCYHHHQQQTVKKVSKLLMQQLLCYWPVVNVIYHSPRIVSACLRVRQGRNAAGQILESCCRCRQLHKSFTFVTNKKSQILQYKDLNDSIYLDFLAFSFMMELSGGVQMFNKCRISN